MVGKVARGYSNVLVDMLLGLHSSILAKAVRS